MKTEISRNSHQLKKRYSGVYQQQGRMLTDSDWNELVDILKQQLNDSLKDVVGSEPGSMGGTPRQQALRMIADGGDVFRIRPGQVYVDGQAARVPGTVDITYGAQVDFPSAPAVKNDYLLYADVWERTVTQLMDARLRDVALHGADTCTRKQKIAQIKWGPYDKLDPAHADNNPEQSAKNPPRGNAELGVTLMQTVTSPNPCDPCEVELGDDSIIGNYLFRVEVHDVRGNADGPSEITLKWSSENGALQFDVLATADMPAGFVGDRWVYEFFDETSERHLGVHLDPAWTPVRGVLVDAYETGPLGAGPLPGSSETRKFVRRWDGYCTLNLDTSALNEGIDKGIALNQRPVAEALGDVSVGASLSMILESIQLDLTLSGHAFVAGDYWLAEVREHVDSAGSKLLENATPQGIKHHYLVLGRVVDNLLQLNPEADRKFAFPSLSELTRLFMAGGDGQEIVPGEALPQKLRVGVANGEWPVAGADVHFQIDAGAGSLLPADGIATSGPDGIAECQWIPGAEIDGIYRVKASLINPDVGASDYDPPVYFYANLISADQVAYAEACAADSGNTVHRNLAVDPAAPLLDKDGQSYYSVKNVLDALMCKLAARHLPYNPNESDASRKRWKDIKEISAGGNLAEPNTVQEAIDELIVWLESTDIRYKVPKCVDEDAPTVGSGLGLTEGPTKVDAVLDLLLCKLNATNLPIVKNDELCDRLKKDDKVESVQDAIDKLCKSSGGGCAITVGDGGTYKSLEEAFKDLENEPHISICLLSDDPHSEHETDHEIGDYQLRKNSISISGNGTASLRLTGRLTLQADRITLNGIRFSAIDSITKSVRGSGGLDLVSHKNGDIVVEHCSFSRVHYPKQNKEWQPLVEVAGKASLTWNDNGMHATRQYPKKSGLLPKPGETAANGRLTLLELEKLWEANPYENPEEYDGKALEIAEKISALQPTERKTWNDKRPVNKINGLPSTPVRLRSAVPQGVGLIGPRPGAPRPTAQPREIPTRIALSSEASPKKTVEGFYELISGTRAPDVAELAKTIRTVAEISSATDYALTLASHDVFGWISNNRIQGYIGLHYRQGDVPVSWKFSDGKESWKSIPKYLSAKNQMNIHGNTIDAVFCMLNQADRKTIADNIESGDIPDSADITIPAYESLTVRDNVFVENVNSFTGSFLNLSGNHFFFELKNRGPAILAFGIGRRCMYLGNISNTKSGESSEYRIEQLSEIPPLHGGYESNFLRVL